MESSSFRIQLLGLNCRNGFIRLTCGPIHGLNPQYSILFILTCKYYSVSFFYSIEEHLTTLKACGGKKRHCLKCTQLADFELNALNHFQLRIKSTIQELKEDNKAKLYTSISLWKLKLAQGTVHNKAAFCKTYKPTPKECIAKFDISCQRRKSLPAGTFLSLYAGDIYDQFSSKIIQARQK